MKTFCLALCLLASSATCYSQFTRARLQASGLTCAMCSNAINKALLKLNFVSSVKPDIKNSAFDVVFKTDPGNDIDELKDAVEGAGFSVAKLQLTGEFDHIQVVNDKHATINGRVFHFLNVHDQVLNGQVTITMLDHDFVTAKEFKRISKFTAMKCLQTGRGASCCEKDGIAESERIYHVTL